MDHADPQPDAQPRAANVNATASAGDGRATAHVHVRIVLCGPDRADSPHRLPDVRPAVRGTPPSARLPRRLAAAGILGTVLVAAAFAAGALIF